ncbi:MAG: CPBP family glutamic-type intramembrane protease [Bryobacteraceae bacterium]|jgi:membrane protease YdiL (CAAX protease family)
MQFLIPALFLSLVLALLCPQVQAALKKALTAQPARVFFAPLGLSALFCLIAAGLNALSVPLAALMVAYTLIPTSCAYWIRRSWPPVWMDFGIILMLWFPLEFAVGARWTPPPVQGILHIAAYGVSVSLALNLFLLFRRLEGMKYNLPRSAQDFTRLMIGFAASAPILLAAGMLTGFLPPFHLPPRWSPLAIGGQFLVILAATALPEEILFRGLIQNALMQKLGATTRTLLLASVIFGLAHLDNGPGPLPNWRYAIVAAIAGFAYGKVFQSSSSIFASAGLHALVNLIKHNCF